MREETGMKKSLHYIFIVLAAVLMLLFRVSSSFVYLLIVNGLFSAAYTSIQPMGVFSPMYWVWFVPSVPTVAQLLS